jgi:hypothetical protein
MLDAKARNESVIFDFSFSSTPRSYRLSEAASISCGNIVLFMEWLKRYTVGKEGVHFHLR